MEAKKIKELAGEAISCELGLVDWQSTLDFICEEHEVSDEDREKIDTKIQKMVHQLIINLGRG
jgi:phosphoribosylformylglycinamidine (FGAM) synthase PurS component